MWPKNQIVQGRKGRGRTACPLELELARLLEEGFIPQGSNFNGGSVPRATASACPLLDYQVALPQKYVGERVCESVSICV